MWQADVLNTDAKTLKKSLGSHTKAVKKLGKGDQSE
jgi:hypothetical protein